MLDLSGELGSTALSLAKGPGFDDIQPAVFRSVLDGYVAGGGALPLSGPSWFVFMIGGWLGFTRWNILRCLAGVEASTGPELALSHESVRNGVRGLPDMFGRLPDLEALLVPRGRTLDGRKQLSRSVRRRGRLADRHDAEPSSGKSICHGVQRPVPESQPHSVAVQGVVLGVFRNRKVVGLGIHDRIAGGWFTETISRPPGFSTRRSSVSGPDQSSR